MWPLRGTGSGRPWVDACNVCSENGIVALQRLSTAQNLTDASARGEGRTLPVVPPGMKVNPSDLALRAEKAITQQAARVLNIRFPQCYFGAGSQVKSSQLDSSAAETETSMVDQSSESLQAARCRTGRSFCSTKSHPAFVRRTISS